MKCENFRKVARGRLRVERRDDHSGSSKLAAEVLTSVEPRLSEMIIEHLLGDKRE